MPVAANLLEERGRPSLETARRQNNALRQVKIVLPHMTFSSGELTLRVGKKNLTIISTLGHSQDGIAVLVEEDRVLFAGDAFMPLPYVVDGDLEDISASIRKIGRMGLENIIQGHGDIILRGEIEAAVKENLNYLSLLKKNVKAALRRRNPEEMLETITIESVREEPRLPGWAGQSPCTSATCARSSSSGLKRPQKDKK